MKLMERRVQSVVKYCIEIKTTVTLLKFHSSTSENTCVKNDF